MEEQKKNPAQGLSESEQVQVRRQKLADLQAAGRDPFTLTKFPQDAYSADLKEEFKDLPNETDSGKKVALAGRLMSKRVMGKASFAHLRDDKGDIQLYVRRDELGDDAYAAFKKLDVGDIIGVKGEVFRTKTGELSARAEETTLLPPVYRWRPSLLKMMALELNSMSTVITFSRESALTMRQAIAGLTTEMRW